MFPNLKENMKTLMREINGPLAVHIFDMAVYFDPSEIRIWMFLPVIPDRSELKIAIHALHNHELVMYSEGTHSFVVDEQIRSRRTADLKRLGVEEMLLKKSISFLKMIKPSYYRHFSSTFQHVKRYPRLLEDLGDLPGNMLMGMIGAKEYALAVDCGKEWTEFLTVALGESHWTVLHLRSRFGLALLDGVKSSEAIGIVIDVYQKTCNTFGEDEIPDALSIMAKVILGSSPANKTVSEKLLRLTVFREESVSECNTDSNLDKWIHYANLVSTFGLNEVGISILEDVIECKRRISAADDDSISDVMQAKARLLTAEGRYSEALEILREIRPKWERKYNFYHRKSLQTLLDMEKVFISQGDYKRALNVLEAVESRIRIFFYEEKELFVTARLEMIRILVSRRLFNKAFKLCFGVERRLVAVYGELHPRCFDFRRHVGDITLGLHQRYEALSVFREVLAEFENSYELEPELEALRSRAAEVESGLFNAAPGTLHWCARHGDSAGVERLIGSGVDADAQDSNGLRALHFASEFGAAGAARVLLRNGANYAAVCKEGCIPQRFAKELKTLLLLTTVHVFFDAVHRNDVEAVLEIAGHEPCVLGARNVNGATALGLASGLGHVSGVKALLSLDSDPNVPGSFTTSFTYVSPQCGRRRGQHQKVAHSGTPLLIACFYGHLRVAEELLKKTGKEGLRAQRDPPKDTPLHAAAEGGRLAVVKFLLSRGAVYCARDADGQMPRQRTEDSEVKELLRFVEGMFEDAGKRRAKAVDARLKELRDGEVKAVAGARNDQGRTLVQVAMRNRNVVMARKLTRRFRRKSRK